MPQPVAGKQNVITPDPGIVQSLNDKDGAAFNAAVLPASQAWLYTEIFNVSRARLLSLFFAYNAHASTTTGQAKVRIMVSNADAAPAFGDDSWYEVQLPNDTNGTAAALVGALGTGWDATTGPLRNVRSLLGGTFLLPAAVANSDKIRQSVVVDVTAFRWCIIAVQEFVDTTNRGTVSIGASLTV